MLQFDLQVEIKGGTSARQGRNAGMPWRLGMGQSTHLVTASSIELVMQVSVCTE